MTPSFSFQTGILLCIILTWTSFSPTNSQIAPFNTPEGTLHSIISRFPHLAHLQNQTQRTGNRGLAGTLRRQNVFATLFEPARQESGISNKIFENVTKTCQEHFQYALEQMFSFSETPTWVLQMFDAYGKIPSGILSGHTSEPGDFHECVQIRGDYVSKETNEKQVVRGRYCSTYLLPGPELLAHMQNGQNQSMMEQLSPWLRESVPLEELIKYVLDITTIPIMLPMMGTCFPASCSAEDVQLIFTSFHKHVSLDLLSQVVIGSYVEEKPSFDAGDITMIVVLVVIGLLCITGTFLDVQSSTTKNNSFFQGSFIKFVLAFSFYTNTIKLLSTKAGSDNLGCLHGLRFMSMGWVVLCHTFLMAVNQINWNQVDVKLTYQDWSFYPILNGTVSVDTFFTLSGTLVAYHLLKELDKRKGRFNYIMFIVHRYLRLTPTYVIIMGIMATLLPYVGSGPMWSTMETESANCAKYWWHNILYINNLVKYDETGGCYGEAWYLANDMQFFLLSPLLIYPLWRWKRIGLGLITVLTIVAVIVPTYITAYKGLAPTLILSIPIGTYFEDLYMKPWTRFGPYVVGIFLGYLLHYRANNMRKFRAIPKWFIFIGWTLSTALALGVIFGGMYYFQPKNAEVTFSSFHAAAYSGLHRTIWGVCIAWIVFACVSGYGGWVNKLLSMKIFMPLGRLTFCMYITSYHIQLIYALSQPHAQHYSKYSMVQLYFAHMVMSGLVAYLLTISLESPFIQLEKMLFASQMPARTTVQHVKDDDGSGSDINGNRLEVKIEN